MSDNRPLALSGQSGDPFDVRCIGPKSIPEVPYGMALGLGKCIQSMREVRRNVRIAQKIHAANLSCQSSAARTCSIETSNHRAAASADFSA